MALLGKKKKSFITSVKYAFNGLIYGIKSERHMKVHLVFTFLVIVGGILLKISYLEWLVCLILIGSVISLELVNTSIERAVDMMMTEIHPLAKFAKDTSAGAVLVMAFISLIIGCIIFIPKIIMLWR